MIQFQNVTTASGISVLDIVNNNQRLGTSWLDFNNDGFLDLYINNHEKSVPILYQNQGNGTFIDVSAQFLPQPIAVGITNSGVLIYNDRHGVATADFDNDGDRDIMIAVGTARGESLRSSNQLLVNQGGTFTNRGEELDIDDTLARAYNPLWLDYDNDGRLDLFVGSNPDASDPFLRPSTIFQQTDNGFKKVGDIVVPELLSSRSSILADLAGDETPELVVIGSNNSFTEARLIVYDTSSTPFTEISLGAISNTPFLPTVSSSDLFKMRDIAAADFNGDLRTDIFLSRSANSDSTIESKLFINTGNGLADKTDFAGIVANNRGTGVVAGDFDNDMDVDLYAIDALYQNRGNGTFIKVFNAGGAAFSSADDITGVTTADYDNDGFLDLFATALPAPGSLLRNQGNSNNWLQIDLEGVIANRDGIGSQILATAGGVTQLREQSGGVHKFSQNQNRIHFGLATNSQVELLEIKWSSGIVQQLSNINANQIIEVTEGIAQAGNDTIEGSSHNDLLVGNNGADLLYGRNGDDTLNGGVGSDSLLGNSGNDTINGQDGSDTLKGGSGDDFLNGNGGNDIIRGQGNNDTLKGEAGNDRLFGNGGSDRLFGGSDDDLLFGGSGDDFLIGNDGDDELSGQQDHDTVNGGAGNDLITGNAGDDILNGQQGNDSISGGGGNDLIVGGTGNDTISGNGGSDRFRFTASSEGIDTINDFSATDTIEIVASGFGGELNTGVLNPNRFVVGTVALDSSDRFVYNSTTGHLAYDSDGTGINSAITLAILSNQASLNSQNIIVI